MSLKILPVKQLDAEKNKFNTLNPILVKPAFLGVFNGSTRAGKSTVLTNFLYNPNFYKDCFNKISPTVLNDETLRFIREDNDIIKVSKDLDELDSMLDFRSKRKRK